MSEVCVSNC